ncbi:Minor histocompatibility antigen H13 [Bulinus truncatus]|nr:Minor histocompatibility antigen H13 [Bulinus truncatus]
MADSLPEQVTPVDTDNATALNGTKIPATPEGMAIAYSSLFLMAVIPIFIGSFRSVTFHKEQKDSGEKPETMSHKDAAMFPIIASCALFGIYIVFQIFSKEYINLLLTAYFFILGVLALTHIAGPIFSKLIPSSFPNKDYHLILTEGKGDKKEDLMNYEFDREKIWSAWQYARSSALWYLWKKHWIANNLFGLAFSINGVELLSLNRVSTGCILLGGLFIYDIFWVFGTNVMWCFPKICWRRGLGASNFAMLGLGDIVIPGIFIALFALATILKRNGNLYFYAGFVAYCLGLGTTIFVMHFFKHAQDSEKTQKQCPTKMQPCFPLLRSAIFLEFTLFFRPIFSKLIPSSFPNKDYHLILTEGKGDKRRSRWITEFDQKDLSSWQYARSLAFGACGKVCGLPQDLLETWSQVPATLPCWGLGDIVIPGIFIALLLRYDVSLKRNSNLYFYAGFVAYCLGLGTTIFVMHFFKHAQPALLYLVPACLGIPTAVALIKAMKITQNSLQKKKLQRQSSGCSRSEWLDPRNLTTEIRLFLTSRKRTQK